MSAPKNRDEWAQRGKAAKLPVGQRPGAIRAAKGIGPNKASGRKGGIRRQGSKRG